MSTQEGNPFEDAYTEQGAEAFQKRHEKILMKPLASNKNIKVSNIGIGTYKGSLD